MVKGPCCVHFSWHTENHIVLTHLLKSYNTDDVSFLMLVMGLNLTPKDAVCLINFRQAGCYNRHYDKSFKKTEHFIFQILHEAIKKKIFTG